MSYSFGRSPTTPIVCAYDPDVLPRVQDLLSKLADIDFAYEHDLEIVHGSAISEDLKTVVIGNLRHLHEKRRAPIVQQLLEEHDSF